MTPRLVTPPAVEPVSLIEAKDHLRVLHDDDDAYITAAIVAARQMVEYGESWSVERTLITTTWRVTLDRFCRMIELPRPPIVAVTGIAYVDTGGTSRTLDTTLYSVDVQGEPGRIIPAYGYEWPATLPGMNGVTVTYTAGYGDDPEDVPMAIRQAILLCLGDLYTFRQSTITGTIVNALPTVRALLNGFKWSYR